MKGDDPIDHVGQVGADLLDQMLAQCSGARGGLVDAAHILFVAAATADLPGLGIAAAIERTVAFVARSVAPMVCGIAREVSGQRTAELLRQRHQVTVGFRRNGIGCRDRRLIVFALPVLQQGVLLDLGLDKFGQLDIRQLQHLDCLLQLRRHHQRLALAQFKPLRKTESSHTNAPLGAGL